jgi:hypothetical protein
LAEEAAARMLDDVSGLRKMKMMMKRKRKTRGAERHSSSNRERCFAVAVTA